MKIPAIIFFALSFLVFISSCSSSRPLTNNKMHTDHTIIQVVHPVSLTNMLLRAPGVYVENDVLNPRVFIRGQQPLFVLDGVQLGYNYGEILRLVDVNTITAVEILKSPTETMVYGRRSGGGVIVIHTQPFELEK